MSNGVVSDMSMDSEFDIYDIREHNKGGKTNRGERGILDDLETMGNEEELVGRRKGRHPGGPTPGRPLNFLHSKQPKKKGMKMPPKHNI